MVMNNEPAADLGLYSLGEQLQETADQLPVVLAQSAAQDVDRSLETLEEAVGDDIVYLASIQASLVAALQNLEAGSDKLQAARDALLAYAGSIGVSSSSSNENGRSDGGQPATSVPAAADGDGDRVSFYGIDVPPVEPPSGPGGAAAAEDPDDREWGRDPVQPTGHDRTPYPTLLNPIEVGSIEDIGEVVKKLATQISGESMDRAVAEGYVISPATPTRFPAEHGKRADTPAAERTSAALLRSVAEDPRLIQIDDRLSRMPDMTGRGADARAEQNNLTRAAIQGVLTEYGVPPKGVTFVNLGSQAASFAYKDSHVRISALGEVIDVVAWDRGLSPEQRDRVWDEHEALLKQGAPLAMLHYYMQPGRQIPAAYRHLEAAMRADHEDIQGAYNQHAQQVRSHAVANRFRSFQIHSPGFRLSVPVALHLLEQPSDLTYDIAGDYSATNGILAVNRPGVFSSIQHADRSWTVTEDGLIVPT